MKKSLHLILILTFFNLLTQAQSIEGSFVNAGFGELQSSIHLTYSLGDIVYGEITNSENWMSPVFTIDIAKELLGFVENSSNWSLSVYPNPFSSSLYIQQDINELLDIYLFDVEGVLLKTHLKIDSPEISLSDVPDGIYMLVITNQDKVLLTVEKVIKIN